VTEGRRQFRSRRMVAPPTEADLRYLLYGDWAHQAPVIYALEDRARALWDAMREKLLADWLRARPGTRPWGWWAFDSTEPRLRLGGIGKPMNTFNLAFGVPNWWPLPEWTAFRGLFTPIDTDDPPAYESEATYLRRLDLFEPGEAERLTERDYAPVRIPANHNMRLHP